MSPSLSSSVDTAVTARSWSLSTEYVSAAVDRKDADVLGTDAGPPLLYPSSSEDDGKGEKFE